VAIHMIQGRGNSETTRTEYMIESAADIAKLPVSAPGSLAYTADLSLIYQADLNGQWVEIGGVA